MSESLREALSRLTSNKEVAEDDRAHHKVHNSRDYEYPGFEAADTIKLSKQTASSFEIEYLNRGIPAKLYENLEKFKDLQGYTGYRTEKTEFRDDEWANEPAVKLYALNDKDICAIGQCVFSGLSVGVARIDLGMLLLLAFQLKAPGIKRGIKSQTRIFPEVVDDIFETSCDIDYQLLESQRAEMIGTERLPNVSGDLLDDATSYAFIAASMLRLFTRSPENYIRAWEHIQKGYSAFYSGAIKVSGIHFHDHILKSVHRQFAVDPLLKSTLFRILYHTNSSDKYESIQNFLYKLHLSYTGMHILPNVLKLCAELKCTSGLLFTCLYNGEFDHQINSLAKLFRDAQGGDLHKKRKMWMYGRIFDQNFMSSLQTRNCARLVYIFAAAVRKEKPGENAGNIKIVQLQDLSAVDKKRCELAADRLILRIRQFVNEGQNGTVSDVFGRPMINLGGE